MKLQRALALGGLLAAAAPAASAEPERIRPGAGYEASDLARPAPLETAGLEAVRAHVEAGRYAAARQTLVELMKARPAEPGVRHLERRLDAVGSIYAAFAPDAAKPERVAARAAEAFAAGNDRDALLLAGYALSLKPDGSDLKRFAARLEDATQIRVPLASKGRSLFDEAQVRAEEAFAAADFEAAADDCREALVLEPGHVKSLERLGTNLYLLGSFDDALGAWRQALAAETDADERRSIGAFLARAEKAKASGGPPPEREVVVARARAARSIDPGEVERLYELGLAYYARRDADQAATTFSRILRLDPENVPARKALERLRRGSL